MVMVMMRVVVMVMVMISSNQPLGCSSTCRLVSRCAEIRPSAD
jgi:hypothetical protein